MKLFGAPDTPMASDTPNAPIHKLTLFDARALIHFGHYMRQNTPCFAGIRALQIPYIWLYHFNFVFIPTVFTA